MISAATQVKPFLLFALVGCTVVFSVKKSRKDSQEKQLQVARSKLQTCFTIIWGTANVYTDNLFDEDGNRTEEEQRLRRLPPDTLIRAIGTLYQILSVYPSLASEKIYLKIDDDGSDGETSNNSHNPQQNPQEGELPIIILLVGCGLFLKTQPPSTPIPNKLIIFKKCFLMILKVSKLYPSISTTKSHRLTDYDEDLTLFRLFLTLIPHGTGAANYNGAVAGFMKFLIENMPYLVFQECNQIQYCTDEDTTLEMFYTYFFGVWQKLNLPRLASHINSFINTSERRKTSDSLFFMALLAKCSAECLTSLSIGDATYRKETPNSFKIALPRCPYVTMSFPTRKDLHDFVSKLQDHILAQHQVLRSYDKVREVWCHSLFEATAMAAADETIAEISVRFEESIPFISRLTAGFERIVENCDAGKIVVSFRSHGTLFQSLTEALRRRVKPIPYLEIANLGLDCPQMVDLVLVVATVATRFNLNGLSEAFSMDMLPSYTPSFSWDDDASTHPVCGLEELEVDSQVFVRNAKGFFKFLCNHFHRLRKLTLRLKLRDFDDSLDLSGYVEQICINLTSLEFLKINCFDGALGRETIPLVSNAILASLAKHPALQELHVHFTDPVQAKLEFGNMLEGPTMDNPIGIGPNFILQQVGPLDGNLQRIEAQRHAMARLMETDIPLASDNTPGLVDTDDTEPDSSKMDYYLYLNRIGRRHCRDQSSFEKHFSSMFEPIQKKPSFLYGMLKANPNVWLPRSKQDRKALPHNKEK